MTYRSNSRARVLSAAARLFTVKGFSGTTMDDVAAAVKLNKATLYHYFSSKTDLLYEIYSTVIARMAERVERARPIESASLRLRQHLRDMFEVLAEMPDESVVYLQEGPLLLNFLPEEQALELHRRENELTDYVIGLIRDGIKDGEFRDSSPELAALAVLGAASWAARWFRDGRGLQPSEAADGFADVFLSGLSRGRES